MIGQRFGPVVMAGLCFLVFAPLELATGNITHNTAIAANASHDAFDGVFLLFFGWLDTRLARASRHVWYCHMRGIAAICVALMAIGFVGIVIAFDHHSQAGLGQMVAALVVGPLSFLLNWYWERQLDPHGHHHEGFSAHLLGDMAGSAVVIVCGPLAYWLQEPAVNVWGGVATLGLVAVIALQKAAKIAMAISHPAEHHHDLDEELLHNH